MTRDEWRAFAESTPATRNQVGAIRREFERLGFGEAGRAERLWITGQLAQAPGQLATTNDLTTGQAGRIVGALTACTSLQDLYAAADPGRAACQRARMRARLLHILAELTSPDSKSKTDGEVGQPLGRSGSEHHHAPRQERPGDHQRQP